jgi:flagellar biosynthesis chaperone FliJ
VSESHRAVAIEMERHCIWIGRFEVAEEVVTRRCQAVRAADDFRYTQFLRCLRNRLVNHSQHLDHFTNNSLHVKKKRSKLKKKKKKVHAWCFIGLAANRRFRLQAPHTD